jgi:ElaB/YqjD/DUF883 family membrane-anchored ribosome-binding protein
MEVIMDRSLAQRLRRDAENTLQDVADILRGAADGLVDDTEKGVAEAAVALRKAADELKAKAPARAKAVAERAVSGVREHPVAAATVALAAAAGLIALLTAARARRNQV